MTRLENANAMIVSHVDDKDKVTARIVGHHYKLLQLRWIDTDDHEHVWTMNAAEARHLTNLLFHFTQLLEIENPT